ncbi:MAG: hypothetical protein IKP28_05375 [Clostridia bacterium]|nr:hypothetical protein [Clostridia bacterium]
MTNLKREGKKKYLLTLLIVLLFALAVGYAAFTDALTITGTANARGSFDIEFTSASVVSAVGVDTANTDAVISNDKNTLTVTCKDLGYPGAGAEYQAVITNVGTVPAVVKSVVPTNITGNGNAIVISGLDAITASHPVLQPNGTCTINFTVQWDPNVNTLDTSKAGEGGSTADCSFSLVINYEQSTTAFTGTTNHVDANNTI